MRSTTPRVTGCRYATMASASIAAGETRAAVGADIPPDERTGLGRGGQLHLLAGHGEPDATAAEGDLQVAKEGVDPGGIDAAQLADLAS